jgi:D-alanyl-D-alanine carboxypeptidase
MHSKTLGIGVFVLTAGALCVSAGAADDPITTQLQQSVDNYVTSHAATEDITGVSLQISLGDNGGPVIAVSSGNDGLPNPGPMTTASLYQVGSNTKSFTAALILKLEADGKLNIDQTLGEWLPQYTAWKSITIRQLLNMTSHIPSYDSTVAMTQKQVNLRYQFTPEQLIAFVDPAEGSKIPPTHGPWSYSNTNYFLAGLIIEKASGMSYKQALETMIIKPLNLKNTYYHYGETPEDELERMPAGFFDDPTCLYYQPANCAASTLAPLLGKDVSTENLSWAGPAGGIITTLSDLALWYRALFGGRVLPQEQLDEMQSVVSEKSGQPIAVSKLCADDPQGYGLGLDVVYLPKYFQTTIWYYEGETLADRVVFAYWPQWNLVVTMVANSNTTGSTFPLTLLPETLTALQNTGIIPVQ